MMGVGEGLGSACADCRTGGGTMRVYYRAERRCTRRSPHNGRQQARGVPPRDWDHCDRDHIEGDHIEGDHSDGTTVMGPK